MPKINLRLTDSEHEALKVWALESHRSIQREAVFRLFSERSLSGPGHSEPSNHGAGEPPSDRTPGGAHGANVLSRPRPESDRDVKTDFK